MTAGHAILPASAECREERGRKGKRNHIKTTETRRELKCFSIKCCQMYEKWLLSLRGRRFRHLPFRWQYYWGEDEYEASVEWLWRGKTEVRGEKPLQVILCKLQISHGLTRNTTRDSRQKLTYGIHLKIKFSTHRERIMLLLGGILT
jgi:hypothetical protein